MGKYLLAAAICLCSASGYPQAASPEVPQTIAPSNQDTSWRPTPEAMSPVLSRTLAYFGARDGGRLEEAYALFAPSHKATVPYPAWKDAVTEFNSRAGTAVRRDLREVTWYKDPPGRTGIYAAVDFTSEFSGLALHCGYVVWQAQADGSFALVREEENAIDKETEAKLAPGQLEQLRRQFRC